ncbi:MAG: glyoxylase-like metal-dependent hydrolase (beta-lactamase superfamily II) [Candidatus Azotimanducaceae bacterium]|jgi:glyoxylase-like metal-dependent hydrolase (beta-lactamase superfamily II)
MRPEDVNPRDLIDQTVGPVTVLFGFENGKYPYGNSLVVRGDNERVIIDPCLGVVTRKDVLPDVDFVLHSHAHEDHIAGTHLFENMPWWVHAEDAIGLSGIDGMMEIYGISSPTVREMLRQEVVTNFYYPPLGNVKTFEEHHVFDLGGVTITALHTPGHTRGHTCFLIVWGERADEQMVYLGDIELTGFGPYYGDAWSDLEDFEASIERLRHVDVGWWLTFHHKGLIEGRAAFLAMLERFASVIEDREQRLLGFIATPRSIDEIVEHRFVYRPGQGG